MLTVQWASSKMEKVIATDAAKGLIDQLKADFGDIIFVHSEGCCEGTSPHCVERSDFHIGARDSQIGELQGIPYYMNAANAPYWKHLQIIIDVVEGRGNSFSLDSTKDQTFVIHSTPM